MSDNKVSIEDIEFVVKTGSREGKPVYLCSLWVRGKKETKISYTVPSWAVNREPTKEMVFEEMLEKARYSNYDYQSWCIHNNWDSNDRRHLSIYNHHQSVAKKLTKLNSDREYFQYTLIATISKRGYVSYEWVADDDWGRVEKEGYFRVYRLKERNTKDLIDRLLRVVRNRYPSLYKSLDPESKIFRNSLRYRHFIAYFYADGRWGVENCEDERVRFLQKRRVAKIFSWKNMAKSRAIRTSIRVGEDKYIWEVEYLLFKEMRRYGIEPVD